MLCPKEISEILLQDYRNIRFFIFFISNLIHCFFVYVQYLLSSFLYMFQASQAHHQEVQIVHAAYGILPLWRCLCRAAAEKGLSMDMSL